MQTPFSYSYFGKDSEKIVFELDNTPFTVDIESKNIKNQVVISHNTTFNNEFLSAFGEETYQKILPIHKKVTHFKVKHPVARIDNTLFLFHNTSRKNPYTLLLRYHPHHIYMLPNPK